MRDAPAGSSTPPDYVYRCDVAATREAHTRLLTSTESLFNGEDSGVPGERSVPFEFPAEQGGKYQGAVARCLKAGGKPTTTIVVLKLPEDYQVGDNLRDIQSLTVRITDSGMFISLGEGMDWQYDGMNIVPFDSSLTKAALSKIALLTEFCERTKHADLSERLALFRKLTLRATERLAKF